MVDALRGYAEVVFVPDVKSLMGPDPMKAPRGLFIAIVGEPIVQGDEGQIRMSMWCGSLCGTARTYGMARQQSAWRVTGTIGSIMVS